MMIGLIDVGGGMRDVYGAGVIDCFLDNDMRFDVCIGVSAGSANIASFLAHQKGRNYRYYTKYASRKEYMGFGSMLKNRSFMNLDYIYSELSNEGGEDPIDFDALAANPSAYIVVATDAETGGAVYLDKTHIGKNDLWPLKASCAIPLAGDPYEHEGKKYFDGGVADPIPLEKSFEMGCDKVVVIIPRPVKEKTTEPEAVMKLLLRRYPKTLEKMINRPALYNEKLTLLYDSIRDGKVILIAPDSDKGLNMITRDADKLDAYYKKGYNDAAASVDDIRKMLDTL